MRTLPIILATILLCGCSATSYRPLDGSTVTGEGFFERQLGPSSYEVSFRGNSNTPQERAVDFTLLRAAELCLLNGCRHFLVTSSEDLAMTAMSSEPTEMTTNNTANTVGLNGIENMSMTTRRGAPRPQYVGTRPGYRIVVGFVDEAAQEPEDAELMFDAASVNDSIRSKYMLAPFDATEAAQNL
jgi:hypothetical protein